VAVPHEAKSTNDELPPGLMLRVVVFAKSIGVHGLVVGVGLGVRVGVAVSVDVAGGVVDPTVLVAVGCPRGGAVDEIGAVTRGEAVTVGVRWPPGVLVAVEVGVLTAAGVGVGLTGEALERGRSSPDERTGKRSRPETKRAAATALPATVLDLSSLDHPPPAGPGASFPPATADPAPGGMRPSPPEEVAAPGQSCMIRSRTRILRPKGAARGARAPKTLSGDTRLFRRSWQAMHWVRWPSTSFRASGDIPRTVATARRESRSSQ
jgi:hypothetical protein